MAGTHTTATALAPAARRQTFAPAWPVAKRVGSPCATKDTEFGGLGVIIGTVTHTGAVPMARRVRLYDQTTMRAIRETWSNAAGAYAFTGLALGRDYIVIAADYQQTYRAVAVDRIGAS